MLYRQRARVGAAKIVPRPCHSKNVRGRSVQAQPRNHHAQSIDPDDQPLDDAALRAEMTALKARFNSPTPAQRKVLEMGFKINSKQPEVRAAGMPSRLHSALAPE